MSKLTYHLFFRTSNCGPETFYRVNEEFLSLEAADVTAFKMWDEYDQLGVSKIEEFQIAEILEQNGLKYSTRLWQIVPGKAKEMKLIAKYKVPEWRNIDET